ncbi:MAG TPA: DUF3422 domain-containing protein [Alphaproteobacteria bacterium]|nr:DUF3422 domain-containing protein [Alphaproteobacteria bacterium]
MRPHRFTDHPHRSAVQNEVHARPVAFVAVPARVRRVALLLPQEPHAVEDAHRRFAAWCRAASIPAPPLGARQHGFAAAGHQVTWELHTEFVTLTWIAPPDDADNWPAGIGLEAFEREQLVAAARIDVIAAASVPEPILAGFAPASLCVSRIDNGHGEVATDFVADADGFTRFELAGGGLGDLRRAIIVRRLLEIETYRTLALLGLPLARAVTPALNLAESRLGELVGRLASVGTTEEAREALAALHALAVDAGALVEQTSYRFAASHAYGEVLRARLAGLREEALPAGSTLGRYLLNRVDPALKTCLAVEKREGALNDKIERATELLNTRISLEIQTQNRTVLSTIAETARSQFRLQKTVEGLSTIAISYYLLGILSYVLTGVSQLVHLDKTVLIALAAPVVLLGVWLLVRSIRGTVD